MREKKEGMERAEGDKLLQDRTPNLHTVKPAKFTKVLLLMDFLGYFLMKLNFALHQSTEVIMNIQSFQETPEILGEGSGFSHVMDTRGLEEQ